ncbi:MAG: hypothetical protein HQK87_00400 [Nitrospinae bacterium]|nr:hypothetical protein [Nitrospinota bacterium]
MRLTITLQSGRASLHVNSVVRLAKAARTKGHAVTIFLMADGVTCLAEPSLLALAGEGVVLSVCEHNRSQYEAPAGIETVRYESQYEFAGFVADADRTVGFF